MTREMLETGSLSLVNYCPLLRGYKCIIMREIDTACPLEFVLCSEVTNALIRLRATACPLFRGFLLLEGPL